MSEHLNQSMWGFQQQFRISLDGATDRALDQIGAILSPEAYIVGFAVGGDDTGQVCLEVRDGAEPPFTADDFGGVVLDAKRRYQESQVHDVDYAT